MPSGLGDEIFWMCPTLESSAVDLSPTGRTLTLNNGASLVNDTSEGGSKAYEFDGTNDTITTTTIWGGGHRTLSWSTWLNCANSSSDFSVGIFNEATGEYGGTISVGTGMSSQYTNNRQFYAWIQGRRDSSGFGQITATNIQLLSDAVVAGWQHFAFVWRDNRCFTYVNGNLSQVGTLNRGVTTYKYGNPVTFGRNFRYFSGKLDDFRAYSRALNPIEIKYLASRRGILDKPAYGLFTI